MKFIYLQFRGRESYTVLMERSILFRYNSHALLVHHLISASEHLIKYETCCNYNTCNAIIDDICKITISASKNAFVVIAVAQIVDD